ncbi:hypothetical protein C8J57DRAFT_956726, partial [Mycena rebaudengoi]
NGTSAEPSLFSSFSLSNNLVEIGALTALIGSGVAEALVLGNRGAAGVAWAATSSFGTISVVKACISGATSGWVRETLGIRTKISDSAVGLELQHDSTRAVQVRRNIGEPLAIFCRDDTLYTDKKTRSMTKLEWSDVYSLDHSTSLMLRAIPETALGSPLQVFTYGNYTFFRHRDTRFQVPVMLLSMAKMIEAYVLWRKGAALLGLVSATPWLFFFSGAIIMELSEHQLLRRPEPELGPVDIVAGELPIVSRSGGYRKVILGVADNPRRLPIWRLFWVGGAMVSTSSIALMYVLLGQLTPSAVLFWAGFQLLWLGIRILVYHLGEPANPMSMRMLVVRPWSTLPVTLKERVIDLTFSLAKSQTLVHPRGLPQYMQDSFTTSDLELLLDGNKPHNIYPLPDTYPPSFKVEIRAVFGDTSLSSAMWITGSHTTPMDLYDSCIVVFTVRETTSVFSPTHTVAIPASRVLSGVTTQIMDPENNLTSFVPRGVPNEGYGVTWWYWIPCRTGLWLQIQVPLDGKTIGIRQAEVRTDAQVSALLAAGKLNIGLKDVEEIRPVVELSRK